jgi:hypothetical protein
LILSVGASRCFWEILPLRQQHRRFFAGAKMLNEMTSPNI